jgi:hypothetical protein
MDANPPAIPPRTADIGPGAFQNRNRISAMMNQKSGRPETFIDRSPHLVQPMHSSIVAGPGFVQGRPPDRVGLAQIVVDGTKHAIASAPQSVSSSRYIHRPDAPLFSAPDLNEIDMGKPHLIHFRALLEPFRRCRAGSMIGGASFDPLAPFGGLRDCGIRTRVRRPRLPHRDLRRQRRSANCVTAATRSLLARSPGNGPKS